MVKFFLSAFLGIMFILSGCAKREVEADTDLDPDCNSEDYEVLEKLSNEVGEIVLFIGPHKMERVRILYRGSRLLDPCNLPEGMPVGSKIRYSGIWYSIKNTDHLNMDFLPLGLSKVEIIDSASEK
ncbi:hypothetical protein GCM10023091_07510 [Ravibacter arvi]|uniref:Lipoprotein n=1 Tax=Ravibacter arvi TaxID=2051041 RepID=A0ABP8LSK9_9BACT